MWIILFHLLCVTLVWGCTQTSDCHQHGYCNSSSLCECFSGYTGDYCQYEIHCSTIDDCYQHGYCNLTTQQCICFDDYYGNRCEYDKTCHSSKDCVHGECNSNYRCDCQSGYAGKFCNISGGCNSDSDCIHGTCDYWWSNPTHLCDCYYGYTGSYCDISIKCRSNSECNNGVCVSYKCQCDEDYRGTYCKNHIDCEEDAECNHGVCNDQTCECDSGWANLNSYCDAKQKEQTTAIVLSAILFCFGAGRYYLGYYLLGTIQLILFWSMVGLFTIWYVRKQKRKTLVRVEEDGENEFGCESPIELYDGFNPRRFKCYAWLCCLPTRRSSRCSPATMGVISVLAALEAAAVLVWWIVDLLDLWTQHTYLDARGIPLTN